MQRRKGGFAIRCLSALCAVAPLRLYVVFLLCATTAHAWELTGYVATEGRLFWETAAFARQGNEQLSLVFQPELFHEWDDGRQQVVFTPFLRLDSLDNERTHGDIRELSWLVAGESWELRVGVRKVYWGVTESQHLVDILNQTDLIENIDTEDKLGQPMVNVALIRDWGTIDLYYLPYFRERTFPGRRGRLRGPLVVDTDHPLYAAANREYHPDFAIRYSHTIGPFDIGVAHFTGTGREPTLVPVVSGGGDTTLRPRYDTIDQTSIDLQAVVGDWLWKVEAIRRAGQGRAFVAATTGFEYTFVAIGETDIDLGLVGEWLFDDRGEGAPTLFEDDLFAGVRLTLNDPQSTDLLAGVISDLSGDGHLASVEASRRIGDRYRLSVEARLFLSPQADDPIAYPLRRDSLLQLELARYF